MSINLSITNNTINEYLDIISEQYKILHIFNTSEYKFNLLQLQQKLLKLHKDVFLPNERIIFTISEDIYNDNSYGILLKSIQSIINTIDISNFFIIVITTNNNIKTEYNTIFKNYSSDNVSFNIVQCSGEYKRLSNKSIIEYSPYNVIPGDMSNYTLNLVNNNNSFCIMPWIQLQTDGNKNVYPCCISDRSLPISEYSTTFNKMANSDQLKQIRLNMLSNILNKECINCNTNEQYKKTSHRTFYNNRFIHHIDKVQKTSSDGSYDVKMIAWNIQFGNLCNLKCRTCRPQASTSWINDAKKLGYPKFNSSINSSNVINQHLEHIDNVEQIYFAGGEPLIMDEHYYVLDELLKRNRVDVELVYNTNFTQLTYKGISIFNYWKKFDNVSVGASLDAMGDRAEYWRSGTEWHIVENNRKLMINECPNITFSIDATVSLVNALHIADFHKNWTNRGFITADQFNPKFLKFPYMFSIIQAPKILKNKIKEKYKKHLEWLIPLDHNGKSTNGYISMINAMENDTVFDYNGFWKKINEVDNIRNEKLLDVFPELVCLK